MKGIPFLRVGMVCALGTGACLPAARAADPAWWNDPATKIWRTTPATTGNFAPINVGQLKNVALQAKRYLDIKLAFGGGAGSAVTSMCQFSMNDNSAPANIGQLKNVAKVFYDRLAQVKYNWQTQTYGTASLQYPWSATANVVAENQAPANIGQLKNMFAFELSSAFLALDTDGDALPDWWEYAAGTIPTTYNADTDTDGDGMLNSVEKANGFNALDPLDALYDKDGDRIPNIYELQRGTDPGNAASFPAVDMTVDASAVTETSILKKTLASGITAVNSQAGDYKIIWIKSGSYSTGLGISVSGKKMLLMGQQGSSPPLFTCVGGTSGFSIFSDACVLDSLAVTSDMNFYGPAIYTGPGTGKGVRIVNCILRGNRSSSGAGISIGTGSVAVDHCTLVNNTEYNTSTSTALGIAVGSSTRLLLRNSIVWNPPRVSGSAQISVASGATCSVLNSIVYGGERGGLNLDPQLTLEGLLRSSSPLITMIQTDALSAAALDIHGEIRSSTPDPGADEFVDSDLDGMADSWEIKYFTNLSSTGTGDPDLDGLKNLDEYLFDLDPTKADTYGYGVSDFLTAVSTANVIHPSASDLADTDGDGLTAAQEALLGTNPALADTNGDGITDGVSLTMGINPLNADTDGDGVSNALEKLRGTSPLLADSDGDGVSDSLDAFPLDYTASTLASTPGDTVAPVVTLIKPPGAVLVP